MRLVLSVTSGAADYTAGGSLRQATDLGAEALRGPVGRVVDPAAAEPLSMRHEPPKPEKQDNGSMLPHNVPRRAGVRFALRAGPAHRGDLVHHDTARVVQPFLRTWLRDRPDEGRLGRLGVKGADRHGVGRVESVVLDEDQGPRLLRISILPWRSKSHHGSLGVSRDGFDERSVLVSARRGGHDPRLAMGFIGELG